MLSQDGFTPLVAARILDMAHRTAPWQRRLWQIGTVLSLREVIEYSELVEKTGIPSHGLAYVCRAARREVEKDPGCGPSELRTAVIECLDEQVPNASARERLGHLTDRVDSSYLPSWRDALSSSPPVERTARALAAHLLDADFSPEHLHRWLTALTKSDQESWSLAEIFDAAAEQWLRAPAQYEIVIPFNQLPPGEPTTAMRWEGPEVKMWLTAQGIAAEQTRYVAALRLEVPARDPWAAVTRASELVARWTARAAVGSTGSTPLAPSGKAWVAGKSEAYDLAQPQRQIEVHSLSRLNAVFKVDHYSRTEHLDDALELAASLEGGSPGAAITGGWAAIEGLLGQPREQDVKAADRMAALIACSWPRAELTTLGRRYAATSEDELAQRIRAADSNRDVSRLVEDHLRTGARLALAAPSDFAAEDRMLQLIQSPKAKLESVRYFASDVFRRLYNQRNLIMHGSSFRSVALSATLRTAPALVGAGLDRIVHAALTSSGPFTPTGLAARAEAELELVGTAASRSLADLLEPAI